MLVKEIYYFIKTLVHENENTSLEIISIQLFHAKYHLFLKWSFTLLHSSLLRTFGLVRSLLTIHTSHRSLEQMH